MYPYVLLMSSASKSFSACVGYLCGEATYCPNIYSLYWFMKLVCMSCGYFYLGFSLALLQSRASHTHLYIISCQCWVDNPVVDDRFEVCVNWMIQIDRHIQMVGVERSLKSLQLQTGPATFIIFIRYIHVWSDHMLKRKMIEHVLVAEILSNPFLNIILSKQIAFKSGWFWNRST